MRRRKLLQAGLVTGIGSGVKATGTGTSLLMRPMPRTGERLPAVGLGTWLTFDVPTADAPALARCQAVVDRFVADGGRVVDSSPMYGHAEAVLGEVLPRAASACFAMSKVWTPIIPYGPMQMRRSMALWRRTQMDVMLVHNLLAWQGHLNTLRQWQHEGLVRHVGVSTSHGRAHDEMREILGHDRIDVMQITYNPTDRSAEPLLDLASARGVAVIINRPFDGGDLLDRLAHVPLPPVAADLGCTSWATLVLKWELAHPAVTVAIPATTNTEHVAQNLAALRGPLPDLRERETIWRAMAPAVG
ncbi:MAG: aldo/keto reductase [Aquincola sp.]|nr:aldo/keto reductase [Aquincola sp.]MDH4287626.1 aldo/keto reductase [Aquincola sp.]MDH5331853.1 aldo/keto reductase [Aquincola sp.]